MEGPRRGGPRPDAGTPEPRRGPAAAGARPAPTPTTFRTLARLAGAAPSGSGLWAPRALTRTGLRQILGFIRHIAPKELSGLEGVSASRAHQLLAGAVVAEAAMRRLGVDEVEICPWALREGVILRRLDQLEGS